MNTKTSESRAKQDTPKKRRTYKWECKYCGERGTTERRYPRREFCSDEHRWKFHKGGPSMYRLEQIVCTEVARAERRIYTRLSTLLKRLGVTKEIRDHLKNEMEKEPNE